MQFINFFAMSIENSWILAQKIISLHFYKLNVKYQVFCKNMLKQQQLVISPFHFQYFLSIFNNLLSAYNTTSHGVKMVFLMMGIRDEVCIAKKVTN